MVQGLFKTVQEAFLWITSCLGEVSGIFPASQNFEINGSNPSDKINIEHNVEMARGQLPYK